MADNKNESMMQEEQFNNQNTPIPPHEPVSTDNEQTDSENLPEKDENGEYINRHTDNNTSAQAAFIATHPQTKLASGRRDPSSHPDRANEATDRNDSGSGGIAAGGAKSGSTLQ